MSSDTFFRNSLFAVRPIICMMQEDSSAVDGGAAEGLDFEEGWESIDQAPVEADMEDLRSSLVTMLCRMSRALPLNSTALCLHPNHLLKKKCVSTT